MATLGAQVGGHGSENIIIRKLWPKQMILWRVWRAWEVLRLTPPFDTHGNFESREQSNSQPESWGSLSDCLSSY